MTNPEPNRQVSMHDTDLSVDAIPLTDLLANYVPGGHAQPWTWDDEQAEILGRECLCCGRPGHYQQQLEAHLREHGLTHWKPEPERESGRPGRAIHVMPRRPGSATHRGDCPVVDFTPETKREIQERLAEFDECRRKAWEGAQNYVIG